MRFPVQPVRHRSRGIHYKDDVLVRGVLRRHLDECEMLLGRLLPLTLTAQEYGDIIGARIELESDEISGWLLLNGQSLRGCDFGVQSFGDLLRDLTLD